MLELSPFHQIIQISDISLMMLAMMKLERFFGHVWLQRIDRVRENRESMFHDLSP